MCGRAPDRTRVLLALCQDPRNDRRGRKAKTEAYRDRNRPGYAQHVERACTDQACQQQMDRGKAEQVTTAFFQFAERDMHADIEEQEDHAELGQQMRAATLMDQVQHARTDQNSREEVANDGAEIERAGHQGGCRAEPQQGDCGNERAHGVGRAHFSGHGGALSSGWSRTPNLRRIAQK